MTYHARFWAKKKFFFWSKIALYYHCIRHIRRVAILIPTQPSPYPRLLWQLPQPPTRVSSPALFRQPLHRRRSLLGHIRGVAIQTPPQPSPYTRPLRQLTPALTRVSSHTSPRKTVRTPRTSSTGPNPQFLCQAQHRSPAQTHHRRVAPNPHHQPSRTLCRYGMT